MVIDLEKQQSKYRFERKFIIAPEKQYEFLFELKKKGFIEIHEQRTINNMYLDDYEFSNVVDNIEGVSERKKTRIRWYGDMFSESKKTIEFKIKSSDVNRKETIALKKCSLKAIDEAYCFWENIKDQLETANHKKYFKNKLFAYRPTLINSYQRNYYLSADESIRVTLDKALFYYSPIYHTTTHDQQLVIEFKYNVTTMLIDNLFKDLVLSKYSKYVKGVLSTSTYNPLY